jgi:hypothetical protein
MIRRSILLYLENQKPALRRDFREPYLPGPIGPCSNPTISFFGNFLRESFWLGNLGTRMLKGCCSVMPSRFKTIEKPYIRSCDPFLQSRHTMEHTYHIDDHVFRQIDGPQGREVVEQSNVYTILALLPVEADGRLRYRIKSKEENFERVVTEDTLSHLN